MRRLPWLVSLFAACAPSVEDAAREPWFAEVPGPLAVHDCGPVRTHYMPEIMGPGCALFDADGDGDLDAYLVNGGPAPSVAAEGAPPRNRLLLQTGALVFTDASAESGADDPGYGMGVAAADADGDGRADLYVTNYGANVLLRGLGGGRFADVTEAAGVAHPGWSTSAGFVDVDADGDLDLYVANYVELDPERVCRDATGRVEYCGPADFPGVPDALYLGRGDGTFDDASGPSGVAAAARRGLGVVCADLSGDGRADVYVANDDDPNLLWVPGDGVVLHEEALARGVAFDGAGREEAGMGVIAADLDRDGDLDLALAHLEGETNTIYLQEGPGFFRDATAELGLVAPTLPLTGFGLVAADLDHDGAVDLVQVNGHVARRGPQGPQPGLMEGAEHLLPEFWRPYAQPGSLFVGGAGGHLSHAPEHAGPLACRLIGRGLAAGDLDADGDLDLLTTATAGPARVLENVAPRRGHALFVRALDADGHGVPGATLVVQAGDERVAALTGGGGSYLSASAPEAHLGLGASTTYAGLEVVWPDGARERFPGGEADRTVTVRRGAGE